MQCLREANAQVYAKTKRYRWLWRQQYAVKCEVVDKRCLHCLPSVPNVRKVNELYEDPEHISKKSALCSLHFTADSFTNKTQFYTGFSKSLKLKDNAVLTTLYPTVMLQDTGVSNCFYYVVTIPLSFLTYHLICIELFMRCWPKSQRRPFMRNARCQTTISQS